MLPNDKAKIMFMSKTKKLNLGSVSGSFLSEDQFGLNVKGLIFTDELGNKRMAIDITYDDTGVPYVRVEGRPPIGTKCAYNLRLNKNMRWD